MLRTKEYEETLVATVDGEEVSQDVYPKRLCVYNFVTGQTVGLFSLDDQEGDTIFEKLGYFQSGYGVFSPGGTKICYCGEDLSQFWSQDAEGVYTLDFDVDWFIDLTTSGVAVEDAPRTFATLSNYPNPFNPRTTISFTLPEADHARMVVYNMSGQMVRNLVDTELSAGVHSVVWDGRDNLGIPVSSGIYVTRFISGKNAVTHRMTLVK